jgi:acetamidase/formamidase
MRTIAAKARRARPAVHSLKASSETVHTGIFDAAIPPVLRIEPGDTVVLETMMLMEGALRPGIGLEELMEARRGCAERFGGPHTLTGPIHVAGADPGDVLEVRVDELVPARYGLNYHLPGAIGMGGLPEDFPSGAVRTVELDARRKAIEIAPGVSVPLRPFLGVMGVAPRPGDRKRAAVPDYHGGNIDLKELTVGSTLFLPVWAPGALFSTGDAHAAQGDGEVNVTAVETAMKRAVLRFDVRKDMKLERPLAETPTHWITMGFHADLDEALHTALRDAVAFISGTHGLSPDDAYAVASVAVDFHVTQVVNGTKGIHAMIPKAPFRPARGAGRQRASRARRGRAARR